MRPFPAIVGKIHALASSSSASMNEIASVVESDIAFSARVLTVANSAAMGLVRPCTTIRQATCLLGTRGIANLATAAAALSVVDGASASYPEIAKHALCTAGIARILAPMCGVPADEAFTAALLHDIGLLMLLQSRDALYEELVDQMGPDAEPSLADERALLGFDHAELGSHVLRRWNVPDPLPRTTELHHDIEKAIAAGGHVATLTALVRAADILSRRVTKNAEPDEADGFLLREERAIAFLKLAPEELLARWAAFRKAGDGWDNAVVEATNLPTPTPRMEATRPVVRDDESSNHRGMIIGVVVTLALFASGAAAFFVTR